MYESEFNGDNAQLARHIAQLLQQSNAAGLVTDIDGTISPIEAMPDRARVLPAAASALQTLSTQLQVVAVVSGRTALDAQAMVGVGNLTYIGNHGLEVLTSDGPRVVPEALPWVPRLARVLDTVTAQIEPHTGVIVENKGATGSLHYRLAADPERARIALLEILAREAVTSGLRIEEGRMVINLLPPLTVSKGSAVTWLAREYDLGALVYFGDDVTDAHAFRALKALRELPNGARTLSVGVVGRETPATIRQLADATVPSVHDVAKVLCLTTEMLETGARMQGKVPIVHGHTSDERRRTTDGQRRAGN